jgi:PAS domain S-box-containing protein
MVGNGPMGNEQQTAPSHRIPARADGSGCARDLSAAAILDSLAANVALVDSTGTIIMTNAAWRRFANDNQCSDGADYLGANYFAVCEGAIRRGDPTAAAALNGIRAVLHHEQESFALEYPCHSPAEKRWFRLRATRLSVEGPAACVAAHENITTEKLAEEELQSTAEKLRLSERRYRDVLEDQSDVVSRISRDGILLVVNDAFCRLVGLPRESLEGHKWSPIPVPEDLPIIEEGLARLAPTNPIVTIENRIRTGDGRMRWMQFANRGIFDDAGTLIELQSVGRDITERKELQDQLTASAREIEDLYDSAPCGYHSLDSNGTYIRINATELAWIGCRRDEVIDRMNPTDFFTAAGRAQFQRVLPEFLRTGHTSGLEYDLVGRHGQTRRVSVSATAVRDATGAFKMSRTVMFDVTDRHRALEALRAMTEQLERRVAERTSQLRALASDLEAAEDRERRQIARDLHDDLGQTLAAARVRLAGLCSDVRDDVRVPAQAVAALVDRANASTRALAAQLAPAVLYELGLTPALEWLCEDIGRTFGLAASVHDDALPKPLSEDARGILYRAVRELVINVAKHARTDNATIEVHRVNDRIVIRVTDTGVGYDPAVLAARPRRGLGLVSVRERLSFIGGELTVQSLPAHGTVAVLSAPLSFGAQSYTRAAPETAA